MRGLVGRGSTTLPVSVTQWLATLKRTATVATIEDRLRAAAEKAVADTEREPGDDPQAEFAAPLIPIEGSVQ